MIQIHLFGKTVRMSFVIVLVVLLLGINAMNTCALASEMQEWEGYQISIENIQAVNDNPWGYNAGIIEIDDGDNCIFLTPDTYVTFYQINDSKVSFDLEIHPWVAELSDGAGILIWLMDEEDHICSQETFFIDNSSNWKSLEIDLASFPTVSRIRLLCNNGVNNNNDGDWVVIHPSDDNGDFQNADWEGISVNIEHYQPTEDNPWGINAGIVDTVTDGFCLFLTPDTAASFQNLQEYSLILEMKIHPWVADMSDGAEITLIQMDKDHVVLKQNSFLITSADTVKVNLAELLDADCESVLLMCGNGLNGNSDADWVIIKKYIPYLSSFIQNGYVKSATYYGDQWPINFWNSEMDYLESDLRQIKEDGFDSIILVIPWKEFQISTNPIQYSDYAFERLDNVMMHAQQIGLNIFTRISYTWDFYNDGNEYIFYRFFDLLRDSNIKSAWLDYAGKLYQQLTGYSCYRGGFLTWEDFWGILNVCDIEAEENRIEYANTFGYQEWIAKQYPVLDDYNNAFGTNYKTYNSIPVPHRNEPAMASMYSFFDNYLNLFLLQAQTVFPNLSFEVRLDSDLVYTKDGTYEYYSHQITYPCGNADFVATMYGIPMGFENVGERVSALEAIRHTDYILGNLNSHIDGKPVYVEQFLFSDNTPQFSYNAQIIDDEVDDYLLSVATVLKNYTAGYGIWTYKNYYNNMLYNADFFLGENGWETAGNISFEVFNDSMNCHLCSPSMLAQSVPDIRNHFPQQFYTISFEVTRIDSEDGADVIVYFGDEQSSLHIQNEGTYSLSFSRNSSFDFSFLVIKGELFIDKVRLYSFEQDGFLYNTDNEELSYIDSIRKLNKALVEE